MKRFWSTNSILMGLMPVAAHAVEDLVIDDFEKKRGQWTFEGSAFTGYGSGDYWHPGRFDRGMLRIRGYRGVAMLKSWGQHGRNVDGETGRATSSIFKVERNFIRFMISGGKNPGGTCVNLLVDGKVERSATGDNSNLMHSVAFEVAGFRGKEVQIELVDGETGPWGYVCIDDLIQSDDSGGARLAKGKIATGDDTIWTEQDCMVGTLGWSNGILKINDSPVQIETVRSISVNTKGDSTKTSKSFVRFRNGEKWQVEILTLSKGKLSLQMGASEQTVDISSVASLEFAAGSTNTQDARAGILYRNPGNPVPGTLKWIKKEDVALDSALGILPIPREGLVRYVIPGDSTRVGKESEDEVGLVDGSVLFGKVLIKDAKIILEHSLLETLEIPWENLRYLIRYGENVKWLSDLERGETKSLGPLGPKTGVEYVDFRGTDKTSLSAVRVVPQTIVRYKLPEKAKSEGYLLQTVISPIPGSLGDATITLSVGSREFYRKELSAEDASEKLLLPIPKGNELLLGVEFGKRLAYPCGIDLHDAHIAAATPTRKGGSQ